MAFAAPYFHPVLAPILAGRDVIHFGDNSAANAAAVKGYSAAPDMARIVSALRIQWLVLRVNVWVEYIRSKANWADDPSRGVVDRLEMMGAEKLEFVSPPYQDWSC
jgi:hypothetical protein